MNKAIRLGAVLSLLLTVVLLINFTVIQGFREERYAQNPLNSRTFIELKQINRGNINAGGQVLAESYRDADGLYQRTYPNMPFSFAPVVGYVSDQYGTAGLESGLNSELIGEGALSNRFTRTGNDASAVGNSVELTVDPQLQALAYDQLDSRGYDGAVVALRPSTGAVLAMASTPSFDPNSVVNADTAESAWATLTSDPDSPLLNHATQEQLPPGSIFKIITTTAGLRGGYTPDSPLTGASQIMLPGTTTSLTNYNGQTCSGGGTVTLRTAFALSCNTAFVQMALDVGTDKLREAAIAFGVGEQYDLGLPTAAGSLGDIPGQAELGQSAIGQRDVTMTALQAAVMAAVVANDGKRMEPYVVSRVVRPDLTTVSENQPHQLNEALSSDEAATIKDLMDGSERSTYGYDGNSFASKTGTAEHGDGAAPHVWYVAFDPSKDVAVAVVVKNGGGLGTSATGGQVSAPIGRAVLNAATAGGN
ncbi:Penicillin-binding protein A [Corynebacterium capitovis DSM 44611]|uniref:penicillin-binding transpeptidase domain-containing protein n=1 Tax=Corynebacterium capitovis TaxID=131081 RepID=UPI00036E75E7|nr:penicillin-binding transpeptidase domain-containing protein [Corynebacterium capitovis]WKD56619.1 Penicillin-binding protein A [Corynebacterium capitovis DSM 44611]